MFHVKRSHDRSRRQKRTTNRFYGVIIRALRMRCSQLFSAEADPVIDQSSSLEDFDHHAATELASRPPGLLLWRCG